MNSLSARQLALIDDYCTLFTIDCLFKSKCFKIFSKRPIICDVNYVKALKGFVEGRLTIDQCAAEIMALKRFIRLKSKSLKGLVGQFRHHLNTYLSIIPQDFADFELQRDHQLENSTYSQFKIVSKRGLNKGDELMYLNAQLAIVTDDDNFILDDRNDFSLLKLKGEGPSHLMLGPSDL